MLRIAVFSLTIMRFCAGTLAPSKNAAQSIPGAYLASPALLIGLLVLSMSRRSALGQLTLAIAVSKASARSAAGAGAGLPIALHVRSRWARYASRCGFNSAFR